MVLRMKVQGEASAGSWGAVNTGQRLEERKLLSQEALLNCWWKTLVGFW